MTNKTEAKNVSVVSAVVVSLLVTVVTGLAAAAAEAVAEALDDADHGDAQQERHQAADFGNKLENDFYMVHYFSFEMLQIFNKC